MFRFALLALLCFASSLLGSAVTVLVLAPRDHAGPSAPGYLAVHELVLTDASGRTRMRLQGETFAGAPGGQIVFYDDRDVPRMELAMEGGGPVITLRSSQLPDPDHRRIRIAVDQTTARIDAGHGELEEIVIKSGPPTEPPAHLIQVRGRNGSTAGLFTDPYGHATVEVTDLTTKSVFRAPEARPLLP
jgi:hypothetical protein